MKLWDGRGGGVREDRFTNVGVRVDEGQHGPNGLRSIEAGAVHRDREHDEDRGDRTFFRVVSSVVGEYAILDRTEVEIRRNDAVDPIDLRSRRSLSQDSRLGVREERVVVGNVPARLAFVDDPDMGHWKLL